MTSIKLNLQNTVAATALLAGAEVGSAAVTYVDPPDIVIPATFEGVYLDILTAGLSTPGAGAPVAEGDSYTISYSEPAGPWDVNLFFGGAFIAHSPTFQPYRQNPSVNLSAIHNVGLGSEITGNPIMPEPDWGPSAPLVGADYGGSGTTTGGGLDGNPGPTHMGLAVNGGFEGGTEGYLAFVLNPETAPLYGWMRVTLNDNGGTGLIHDWAYSNNPILVGVPESGALVLLACGSLTLLRRRRS